MVELLLRQVEQKPTLWMVAVLVRVPEAASSTAQVTV